MFKQLVPLNAERHAGKRILDRNDFSFSSSVHMVSIMVHEFAKAAPTYPIVFIEDPSGGDFVPVVLLGLEEGKNLFVDSNGRWTTGYIPALVRRYPFALLGQQNDDHLTVCIDEASPNLNDSEGTALFDEKGQPTEAIETLKRFLGDLYQMQRFTEAFCKFLSQHNLFAPVTMQIAQATQRFNITGCYRINEDRLQTIASDLFLTMREKGYLSAIYAHAVSLAQVDRLLQMKLKAIAE
ncbi:MAG: peptidase [Betaproteobacteria bacterium]|nr:peptidase [Betaproteobacteria bacterium]